LGREAGSAPRAGPGQASECPVNAESSCNSAACAVQISGAVDFPRGKTLRYRQHYVVILRFIIVISACGGCGERSFLILFAPKATEALRNAFRKALVIVKGGCA
jgi:hypothetical protein